MRLLAVVVGLLVLARAGTALAVCGDAILEPPDEQCDGGDCCSPTTCQFEPGGTACRASAGPCDVAETCTGSDAACPVDAKSTGECRPAGGDCDVAESCDGVADDCPTDAFRPSTFPCRAALGVCDAAETCTGSDPACPLDGKSTAECRASVGVCDVGESCDGVGDDCPADGFVAASTPCRAAAGV